MASSDVKFDFIRFDGSSGERYRRWRRELMNFCASKTDESGSSVADYLLDMDMGGGAHGAPAMPAAASEAAKMTRLRSGRARTAYGIIVRHIADADLVAILSTNHFQQGQEALNFLNVAYDTTIRASDLLELDQIWNDLSIIHDIGISEESVNRFAKLLMRVNGERPVGHRHNANAITEKLLEAIANTSRHFSELAMREIDAVAGQRVFVDAGGNRDFVACVEHYNRQWAHAVKRKILIPTPPARRGQAPEASKAGVETLSRMFSRHQRRR